MQISECDECVLVTALVNLRLSSRFVAFKLIIKRRTSIYIKHNMNYGHIVLFSSNEQFSVTPVSHASVIICAVTILDSLFTRV